jgi:hypothetical protein
VTIRITENSALPSTQLHGKFVRVDELTLDEHHQMFALMNRHYENVIWSQFMADLNEKQLLIKVTDEAGTVQGFSTQVLQEISLPDQRSVLVVFSGDTILDEAYWGNPVMPKLCAHFAHWLTTTFTDREIYWHLICKGHKTYHFLPTMFREYYPHHEKPISPDMLKVLDAASRFRYPDHWKPDRGIIAACDLDNYPKEEIATPTESQLCNPATRFFYKRNPGGGAGDSLSCIAAVTQENLTKVAWRMLKSPMESPIPAIRASCDRTSR